MDRDRGFSWIGKCDIDINELAAGQKSSAKKDMAVNYLHTILAENDVASVKIFEEMSRYGFSKRTVQNAKKEAGIQAYKKEMHGIGTWRGVQQMTEQERDAVSQEERKEKIRARYKGVDRSELEFIPAKQKRSYLKIQERSEFALIAVFLLMMLTRLHPMSYRKIIMRT